MARGRLDLGRLGRVTSHAEGDRFWGDPEPTALPGPYDPRDALAAYAQASGWELEHSLLGERHWRCGVPTFETLARKDGRVVSGLRFSGPDELRLAARILLEIRAIDRWAA